MLTVNMDKTLIENNVRTTASMTEAQFFKTLADILAVTPDEDGECLDPHENAKNIFDAVKDNYESYLNSFLWSRLCDLIHCDNGYIDNEDEELDTQIKKDFARIRVRPDEMRYKFAILKDGLPVILTFTDNPNAKPCIGVIYAENENTLRAYVPLYANSFNRDIMYGFWEDMDADDEFIAKENGLDPDNCDESLFESLEQDESAYLDDVIEGIRAAIQVV